MQRNWIPAKKICTKDGFFVIPMDFKIQSWTLMYVAQYVRSIFSNIFEMQMFSKYARFSHFRNKFISEMLCFEFVKFIDCMTADWSYLLKKNFYIAFYDSNEWFWMRKNCFSKVSSTELNLLELNQYSFASPFQASNKFCLLNCSNWICIWMVNMNFDIQLRQSNYSFTLNRNVLKMSTIWMSLWINNVIKMTHLPINVRLSNHLL